MATESQQIMKKLDSIKEELDEIKDAMVDVDTVFMDDDVEAIEAAEADLEAGRTTKLWCWKFTYHNELKSASTS